MGVQSNSWLYFCEWKVGCTMHSVCKLSDSRTLILTGICVSTWSQGEARISVEDGEPFFLRISNPWTVFPNT